MSVENEEEANDISLDITDYKIDKDEHIETVSISISKHNAVFGDKCVGTVSISRDYKIDGKQGRSIPRIVKYDFPQIFMEVVKIVKKKGAKLKIAYKSMSKLEKPIEEFLIQELILIRTNKES